MKPGKPSIKLLLTLVGLMTMVRAETQTQDYIKGRVVDSITGEAIPFATIFLQESRIGVYANSDGDFRLPHSLDILSDSLVVTCIGYNDYIIAMMERTRASESEGERTKSQTGKDLSRGFAADQEEMCRYSC